MQGTVIKVAVSEGQQVSVGDLILVLEAMKMEQPVNAHKSGTVSNLTAQTGGTLASDAAICLSSRRINLPVTVTSKASRTDEGPRVHTRRRAPLDM